jgi:hypothetical protein
LFGAVKDRLERMQASDADALVEQIPDILRSIAVEELERVFAAWIDRIRQVREGNGYDIATEPPAVELVLL